MTSELDGKKVAFVATDGVEQIELDEPWQAIIEAGGRPSLVSTKAGEIQCFEHLDKAEKRTVDEELSDADADDFDALVLPGGVANGDFIRADDDAVQFTKAFFEAGKPVAAICHGLWVLAEAGVLKGRKVTSWPSLKTDLRNAGASWADKTVVTDNGLVTSRKPDDLPAFCAKMVEEFSEGRHSRQKAKV